ncbi:hypothetical protein ARMGADRAFT_542537 [Armillaria gallica]|uniref:Secreted protein n=1 Tax=Armillaria gallica TaxID=47427 RepID=A0A2H3CWA2_ARMGA|nr:hypothetical protein ARMGADRAFT_542537 [Armillaria gallica]
MTLGFSNATPVYLLCLITFVQGQSSTLSIAHVDSHPISSQALLSRRKTIRFLSDRPFQRLNSYQDENTGGC